LIGRFGDDRCGATGAFARHCAAIRTIFPQLGSTGLPMFGGGRCRENRARHPQISELPPGPVSHSGFGPSGFEHVSNSRHRDLRAHSVGVTSGCRPVFGRFELVWAAGRSAVPDIFVGIGDGVLLRRRRRVGLDYVNGTVEERIREARLSEALPLPGTRAPRRPATAMPPAVPSVPGPRAAMAHPNKARTGKSNLALSLPPWGRVGWRYSQ